MFFFFFFNQVSSPEKCLAHEGEAEPGASERHLLKDPKLIRVEGSSQAFHWVQPPL